MYHSVLCIRQLWIGFLIMKDDQFSCLIRNFQYIIHVTSLLLADRVLFWATIPIHLKSRMSLKHAKEDLFQSVYSNVSYPRSHDLTRKLPLARSLVENYPSVV